MQNVRRTFGKQNWWILVLFGLIGQIAWSVENMYFNLFVYETIEPNLGVITLMVQLSGIAATVTTLIAGTLSDKAGNRRGFISYGYLIWGITVGLFGFISPENMAAATPAIFPTPSVPANDSASEASEPRPPRVSAPATRGNFAMGKNPSAPQK